jgi:hypothetical protein
MSATEKQPTCGGGAVFARSDGIVLKNVTGATVVDVVTSMSRYATLERIAAQTLL